MSAREVLDAPTWQLLEGGGIVTADSLRALATMPDCSVDAVVCDPPYGIGFMGHEWDQPGADHGPVRSNGTPAVFASGKPDPDPEHTAGRKATPPGQRRDAQPKPSGFTAKKIKKLGARATSRDRGGAMEAGRYDLSLTANQRYQQWCEAWGRECLRVLKPGGHLLASCGTRTYHRLAAGIEDAGFEIRDSLIWLYGSGFPKSRDIGKAIDSEAGVEREVIGQRTDGRYAHGFSEAAKKAMGKVAAETDETGFSGEVGQITAPATHEAAEWDGWGSAIKPAHEPIVMARKPYTTPTLAANVLKNRTGGLNIGDCRIGFVSADDEAESKDKNQHEDFDSGPRNNQVYGEDLADRASYDAPGRWPANVLLTHLPDCRLVGAAEVDSDGHFPAARGASGYGSNGHHPDSTGGGLKGHEGLDERRTAGEVVEIWDCEGGCPIAMLNAQSGESKSSGGQIGKTSEQGGAVYEGGWATAVKGDPGYGDEGGAARFFYTAKASRSERNAGLEGFETKDLNWSSGDQSPGTFQSEGTERAVANHHPTVKPIALMRWLVRLVTPPGGLIVDPFVGSGSTGCAAVLEGFEFVGIDRQADYAAIAEARIRWWREHQGREADEVLADHGRSERASAKHVDSGQLGLELG